MLGHQQVLAYLSNPTRYAGLSLCGERGLETSKEEVCVERISRDDSAGGAWLVKPRCARRAAVMLGSSESLIIFGH